MRTLAIMNRMIKELLRDKRTLALMFLAPILILFMLKLMFDTNSTTNVTIATVDLDGGIRTELNDAKHVSAKDYTSLKSAKAALKDEKVDAIVKQNGSTYDITYANTDSSKTTATKMAFKNAVTTNSITQMKSTIALLAQQSGARVQTANGATMQVHNHYNYGDADTGFFAKIIPLLIGFFVFFFVFLISGMALLKERSTGTLDRLLATPVKRSEIVFGYMLSYGILAIIQTAIIVVVAVWLLDIEVVGNIFSVMFVNIILAFVALAFGILMSTFARSEFQMMQFIPIIVMPQVFFSGIIPLDSMATWVQSIVYILPIKYAGDAQSQIILHGNSIFNLGLDIGVLLIFIIVLTTLNIVGMKRYRKA